MTRAPRQPYCLLAPLALPVACGLVIGTCGCSPSQSIGIPSTGGATSAGGTTSTGGMTNTDNPSGCVEGQIYPREVTFCSSDDDCSTDGYCGDLVCGDSYTCRQGSLVPSNYICLHACSPYPNECLTAGSALKDHLTDNYCTVMVRVNADTDIIVGYAVNCGKLAAPTASDVLGRLLQTNSINWSGATEITDSRTTGLIVFTVTNGPVQYAAYFSASTGNQLLLTQTLDADAGAASFLSDVAWHDGAELGTSCISQNLGSNVSQTTLEAVTASIAKSNLVPTVRLNLGPIDSDFMTPIDVEQPEFLLFLNAHCANC